MLLSAFAVLFWTQRPTGIIRIEIDDTGAIKVNEKNVTPNEIAEQTKSVIEWNEMWGKEPAIQILADAATPIKHVNNVIAVLNKTTSNEFSIQLRQ